jgi:hypothetical protein
LSQIDYVLEIGARKNTFAANMFKQCRLIKQYYIKHPTYLLRVLYERVRPSRHRWFIVGDSHISSFRAAHRRGLFDAPTSFRMVEGATAVGLRNPNSLTNALAIFERSLLPPKKNVTPVIQLGEVDCGFVIWWRAKKYSEPIDMQLEQSIAAYREFVDKLLRAGYSRIVITGATMPTIQDGQDWGEIANARREVTASLQERTDLTRRYNAALSKLAAERDLPFVDIGDLVLDPATGLIAEKFRHPNKADHHLNPELVAPLWAGALNSLTRQ